MAVRKIRAGDTRPLVDLVVHNIGTLVTPARAEPPLRGRDLRELIEVEGAAVAVRGGIVVAVGPEGVVRAAVDSDGDTDFLDAGGALAIPGLVDCHAHPLFAGDRSHEFELRNTGADYEQLHAEGGGIRTTVAATRSAIDDGRLASLVRRHLDWMLAAGTTTAEAKSGYGLTLEDELASLRVARDVAEQHAVRMIGTCLAAHTVPPEYDGESDRYLDEVAIPAVQQAADEGLAAAADVFLERGGFTAAQARRYLQAARDAGLVARLHSDQFSDQGGVPLAIELGARSVDHLEALAPARVAELAASRVTGVLLPLSSLLLSRPYAPGRALADAGAVLALASDFNPGSSYGESLTLAMSLACAGCGLRAAEALTAATINAAWVLDMHHQVGRIAPGFCADLVLVDQPSLVHLAYHVGSPGIVTVVAGGRTVPRTGVPA